jgi:uncharacterized cupredoxin-like copper-binding protein
LRQLGRDREEERKTAMKRIPIVLVGFALLVLAGCSSGGSSVDVALSEWVVQPDPTSVDAGEITFNADNQGSENHEMVIVRADSVDALPTDADGAVDEEAIPESDFIGEVEELEPEGTGSLTETLSAGTYVVFCNITEEESDGTIESHFAEGMHAVITVNG